MTGILVVDKKEARSWSEVDAADDNTNTHN